MPIGFAKSVLIGFEPFTEGYFEYLVVGGGGGGGGAPRGGGGGGGAAETHLTNSAGIQYFTKGVSYTITVGSAGANALSEGRGTSGSFSSIQGPDIFPIVACGGGAGGSGGTIPENQKGTNGAWTGHPTLRGLVNVSAITKADPCVVTFSSAHNLTAYVDISSAKSNYIHFSGVGGMTQLNWGGTGVQTGVGPIFSFEVVNSTSINLYDAYPHIEANQLDSTGYGTYTSGGVMHPWGAWDGGSAGGTGAGDTPGSGTTTTAGEAAHYYSTLTGRAPMNIPAYATIPGNYATNGNAGGRGVMSDDEATEVSGGGGGSLEAGSTDGDGQGGDGVESTIWPPHNILTYAAGGGGGNDGGGSTGSGTSYIGNGGPGNDYGGTDPTGGAVIIKMRTASYSGVFTPSDSTAPTVVHDTGWTYIKFLASGTYTH